MHDDDTGSREALSQQVIEALASWPRVTVGDGPFNSPAFYVESREIGHMHVDELPSVDITFPQPLRNRLIAADYTNEHPMNSETGVQPTLFVIESKDDVDSAIWLFRLSYLVHVAVLQKGAGSESSLMDIDVLDEVDELEPIDAVRDAFEVVVDKP